ncbi:MAG: hypothetical protein KF914_16690 [Rhizobiaceae bacterium]|nr:hypothetical protein [Rhizobiaceae bacterium]
MQSGWCLLLEYVLVFLFGCALGATELLSRYRDAPLRVLGARASFIYEGLNGVIGVLALVLVHTVAADLVPGDPGTIDRAVYEVLIAGFGGAAFFRTAIARTRVGDQDVGVGPSFVIETLLAVTDREVDRWRAEERARDVAPLMADIPVAFVTTALVPYALNLLQNVSAQERQDIETKIDSIITKKLDEDIKPFIYGLMLVNIVGLDVLSKAKVSLAELIKKKRAEAAALPSEQALKDLIDASGSLQPDDPVAAEGDEKPAPSGG